MDEHMATLTRIDYYLHKFIGCISFWAVKLQYSKIMANLEITLEKNRKQYKAITKKQNKNNPKHKKQR